MPEPVVSPPGAGDITTDAPSPAPAVIEQRRHPRHEAGWAATCIDQAGFSWEAWVVDHSVGGLGLDNCPKLEEGQILQIGLASIGSFRCRVAWSNGPRCGVEFLRLPSQFTADEVETLALGLSGRL